MVDDQRFERHRRINAQLSHRMIPEMIRVRGILQELVGHARSVQKSKCLSLRSHAGKPS